MELIHHLAQAYAEKFSSPENDLLLQLREETIRNHSMHHMLSGHLQGRLLALISKIIQPKKILEIGTFTGYSALCLAEGLVENGELHTIESREDVATIAQNYFSQSNYSAQIILHKGNALTIIEQLNEEWDLVFIDADKINYQNYFDVILPKVRKGGVILCDNVLFHGAVLNDEIKDKNAKAIHAFNIHVSNCPIVETLMLTMRDGISIVRKK